MSQDLLRAVLAGGVCIFHVSWNGKGRRITVAMWFFWRFSGDSKKREWGLAQSRDRDQEFHYTPWTKIIVNRGWHGLFDLYQHST